MNPAIESLWKEFAAQLDRFIRARVEEPATAEDILPDVFMKLQSQIE
jgi:DNA-directed RNA polymerase specialized sigma24 family protein